MLEREFETFDKSFDRYCTNLIMVQINAPMGNIIHKITDECIYTYMRVCVCMCIHLIVRLHLFYVDDDLLHISAFDW